MTRLIGMLTALVLLGSGVAGFDIDLIESPALSEQPASGELPPIMGHVPSEPSIVSYDESDSTPGRYGSDLRIIGIVAGVPQPVVINQTLRNCPAKGIYNSDPGAHFGTYRPDTFWSNKS